MSHELLQNVHIVFVYSWVDFSEWGVNRGALLWRYTGTQGALWYRSAGIEKKPSSLIRERNVSHPFIHYLHSLSFWGSRVELKLIPADIKRGVGYTGQVTSPSQAYRDKERQTIQRQTTIHTHNQYRVSYLPICMTLDCGRKLESQENPPPPPPPPHTLWNYFTQKDQGGIGIENVFCCGATVPTPTPQKYIVVNVLNTMMQVKFRGEIWE